MENKVILIYMTAFVIFVLINEKLHFPKDKRHKQLGSAVIAGLIFITFSFITIYNYKKIDTKTLEAFIETLSKYPLLNLIKNHILLAVNMLVLVSFIVIKVGLKVTKTKDKTTFDENGNEIIETSLDRPVGLEEVFYETTKDGISVKREYAYLGEFFSIIKYIPLFIFAVFIIASGYNPTVIFKYAIIYLPLVSYIAISEWGAFLSGLFKINPIKPLEDKEDKTQTEKGSFEILYNEYLSKLSKYILVNNKSVKNSEEVKELSNQEEEDYKTKEAVEIYNSLIKEKNSNVKNEYLKIAKEMYRENNLILSDMDIKSFSAFLFPYIFSAFTNDKKILVIVDDENIAEKNKIKIWIEDNLREFEVTKNLVVKNYEAWEGKEEKFDLLIISPYQMIHNKDNLLTYFERDNVKSILQLILMNDESTISKNLFSFSIMSKMLDNYFSKVKVSEKIYTYMQTIVFTTESEEKNEGLQKSLGINFQYFRENKIEPKEFYGIIWDEGKSGHMQDTIMLGHENYLGVSPLLALFPWKLKLKNHLLINHKYLSYKETISGLDNNRERIKKEYFNHEQIDGTLRDYLNKKTIINNEFLLESDKERLLFVNDTFLNIPSLINKYSYLGRNNVFINIITRDYLLREYFLDNLEYFLNSPIKSITPKFLDNKFNVATTLMETLVGDKIDVYEDEIKDKLSAAKLDIKNVRESLRVLFEEIYGIDLVKENFLKIVSENKFNGKSFEEKNKFVIEEAIRNHSNFKLFEEYTIVDSSERELLKTDPHLVFQNYLVGQLVSFEGEIYKVDRVEKAERKVYVMKDNATENYIYRNNNIVELKDIIVAETKPKIDVKNISIETVIMEASSQITTRGYYAFKNDISFESGKYEYKELNGYDRSKRELKNGKLIKFKFNIKGNLNAKSDEIALSFVVILKEVFETLFPYNNNFLRVFSLISNEFFENEDQLINEENGNFKQFFVGNELVHILPSEIKIDKRLYSPLTLTDGREEKVISNNSDKDFSIYILEDSIIELGLIQGIYDNFEYIMSVVSDYLNWYFEIGQNNGIWSKRSIDKNVYLQFGKDELYNKLNLKALQEFLSLYIPNNKITRLRNKFYKNNNTVVGGSNEVIDNTH